MLLRNRLACFGGMVAISDCTVTRHSTVDTSGSGSSSAAEGDATGTLTQSRPSYDWEINERVLRTGQHFNSDEPQRPAA
jgi:hypothetical protein